MHKKKKTYELEIHFGLLFLVVIMFCLNIISNLVIYNARNSLKEDITGELYKSSLAIGKFIQNNRITSISEKDKNRLLYKYELDNITLVQSIPNDLSRSAKLNWLTQILQEVPQEQIPNISKIMLMSDYYTLTRANNNRYFIAAPIWSDDHKDILILFKNSPKLAYLDNASEKLLLISLISIFAIILTYILLYRFILSPFRKLREEAVLAGRSIPTGNDEVSSVIDEYKIIIKELKEKEAELLEMHQEATDRADSFEQFNDYLLGSIQAGIITVDKSGKVLTINNSAVNICSIDSTLYLGADYVQLPFLTNKLKDRIDETLMYNIYHTYEEYELINPTLRVGLTISPVCDSETHQIGASILINDISEIKKLQSELEKNRQMSALGEMSAGLAHQLRNSLGAIVGYNHLVKKRLSHSNLDTSIVDSMAIELKESESLIRRFLNFTRPFDYAPESENIVSFISDILDTLSVRNDFKQITINYENKLTENNQIIIDQLLLKQALTNIIENSKNAYDGKEGVIDILITENENNCYKIRIQDYACGIDIDNLEKIFTPFYSTNPSGTGLGLPLAQKIIVLHDGILEVDSTVGEGTTFSILLPSENNTIREKSELFN